MAYQYATLSTSKFRLLALLPGRFDDPLRGELFEAEFSSDVDIEPAYEALSYVWGDQANSLPLYVVQPEGSLNGTIDLGPNLYSALQHLRLEHSRRTIWCDSISINQVNLEERAQEIARMADIYRKALRVVVWLGPEADGSARAMKAIEYAGSQIQIQPMHRTWKPKQNANPKLSRGSQNIPLSPQELQAIQSLIARSWFRRLWVRQEITLARSSVVMAGNRKVSWTHLISATAFLDTFIRLKGNASTDFGRDLSNLVEFGYMKSYEYIMDIIHACRACECTQDQDRVYALLGLLSSQRTLTIQPDYSKGAKKVHQDLVMQYYRHYQRLNILTLCELAETPSWVPDLQKLRLNTGINTRMAQYRWASSEAAASLLLSNDNAIETYGVQCGILDKSISHSVDKNSEAGVLQHPWPARVPDWWRRHGCMEIWSLGPAAG